MAEPASRDDLVELVELVRDVAAYATYAQVIGDSYVSRGPVVEDSTTATTSTTARAIDVDRAAAPPIDRSAATQRATVSTDVPASSGESDSLELVRETIGDCVRCRLHEGRRTIVFGEGNPNATLMFVGEGPGADEDATGRPFVGAAGKLLDRIIEAIGLKREDVYIANVVKCRPPGNRKPEKDEASTCEPFLFRQIDVIRPKVIVALGNTPVESLLGLKVGITRARGEFYEYRGIKVMPTFHPAYLLRDATKKREVWEDMKKVKDEIARS